MDLSAVFGTLGVIANVLWSTESNCWVGHNLLIESYIALYQTSLHFVPVSMLSLGNMWLIHN